MRVARTVIVPYSTVKTRNTHTQRKRRSRIQKFQGGATDRPRKCTVRDLRHYPDLIWTSERARHAVLATITHASKTSDALVREKEINFPSNPPIERSGTWRLGRLPFRTARGPVPLCQGVNHHPYKHCTTVGSLFQVCCPSLEFGFPNGNVISCA